MKITIQTVKRKIKFELSAIIFILLVVLKYTVIFTLMLWTWNSIMQSMLKEVFKIGMMV
mgnify:FL=1|jgi:hypothetical protein